MRKAAIVLALLVGLVVIVSSEVSAAPKWHKGTVTQAGPFLGADGYEMRFRIETVAGKKIWIKAAEGREKEMLSVALASMSNGMQVQFYADVNVDSTPVAQIFYIKVF